MHSACLTVPLPQLLNVRVALWHPSRLVEKLADAKLQSAFDADDIAQDTFLRVRAAKRSRRSAILALSCALSPTRDGGPVSPKRAGKSVSGDAALMPEGVAPSPEERESQLETYNSSTACWTG